LHVVRYLVEEIGADINADSRAVTWPVMEGQLEVVRYLMGIVNVDKGRLLELAVFSGQLDIVKYLVELKADIHELGESALRYAVKDRHLEVVKYLVENGVDLGKVDFEELSENKEVLDFLLKKLPTEKLLPLLVSNNSGLRKAVRDYIERRKACT